MDRIEIASTRVSEGEREAARRITELGPQERVDPAHRDARLLRRQGLGGLDRRQPAGKVLNLLTKGSERHCRGQLGMTPEQHRKTRSSRDVVALRAKRKRFAVNVYLEDWSNGVRESFDYVFAMVQLLRELGVSARIYLPDTLGILARWTSPLHRPDGATWPDVDFEFHAHNDYGLSTANCLAAVGAGSARRPHQRQRAWASARATPRLAEVVAALHDHRTSAPG